MHRRYAKKNIPIELLRALVTIVDTGSYTKAADALDLTQSAISSQIARLGRLLGGGIFAKGQGNMTPTKRGVLVLQYARRMLAMNDELLTFAGPNSAPRQFVIGLPGWLGHQRLIEIFERCSASPTANWSASAAIGSKGCSATSMSARSMSPICATRSTRRASPSRNGRSTRFG